MRLVGLAFLVVCASTGANGYTVQTCEPYTRWSADSVKVSNSSNKHRALQDEHAEVAETNSEMNDTIPLQASICDACQRHGNGLYYPVDGTCQCNEWDGTVLYTASTRCPHGTTDLGGFSFFEKIYRRCGHCAEFCSPCLPSSSCAAFQYHTPLQSCASASGACSECQSRTCPSGYFLSGCGNGHPGTCQQCTTQCSADEFVHGCGGSSEGSCHACSSSTCGFGEFLRGCGNGDPGTCEKCPACPDGEYMVGCAADGTTTCADCTTCGRGEYVGTPCQDGEPGTCASCAGVCHNCVDDQNVDCGGADATCGQCQTCPEGTHVRGCNNLNPGEKKRPEE
eukprot:121968-Rhodomonas_salina.1